MNPHILEIKDLSLSDPGGRNRILESVSMEFGRKKVTGIVGESGSGKSMTALAVMGLLPSGIRKTAGEILFHPSSGERIDLGQLKEGQRESVNGKKISMIFQEPMTSLNPSMKCGAQVDEVIRKHLGGNPSERKEKILTIFEKVRLPEPAGIFSSYPHELSGGQRQRIMIAMAVSTSPSVLIADEPTTALDISIQRNIIELLEELQDEMGLSVIFISHDLRIIKEIADDIIVMRSGRVVEKATAGKLFSSPVNTYTKGLIACQPPLDAKPARLLTIADFEKGIPVQEPESSVHPTPNDKKILLEIDNLSIRYYSGGRLFTGGGKSVQAVRNVSFRLFENETLGLVGESGSGKTTIGKSILRLIRSEEGQIQYRGVNIQDMNTSQRRSFRKNVQVVFQDPYSSLNPRLSVKSILFEARKLHFPGESREERKERVIGLLEKTGLHASDLEKYPHEFSGGQRQRIGIARSLCTEPELIILDEAVSALDVSVQAQILNLLNDLKSEFGLGYIFISHDLAVVRYMSDRMIVLKEGSIVEEGLPMQIFRDPASGYTRKLIESIPGG